MVVLGGGVAANGAAKRPQHPARHRDVDVESLARVAVRFHEDGIFADPRQVKAGNHTAKLAGV